MSITITEEQLQNLLKAAVGAVQQGANDDGNGNERPRVKNPERPEIDLGYSETQWAFFLDKWDVYKRRAALKAEHLTDELHACCSKDLRKTLFDFVGSLCGTPYPGVGRGSDSTIMQHPLPRCRQGKYYVC